MSTDLATVPPGAQVSEAERRLRERGVSCLAVTTDDGKLVGVISRTDLLRVGRLRATMAGVPTLLSLPRLSVQECMVNRVVTVAPDASLAAAARRLGERHIHRLFVVEAGVLVGVLSTKDMMRAIVLRHPPKT